MERMGIRDIDAGIVLPLSSLPLYGQEFPAPAHPERFLLQELLQVLCNRGGCLPYPPVLGDGIEHGFILRANIRKPGLAFDLIDKRPVTAGIAEGQQG